VPSLYIYASSTPLFQFVLMLCDEPFSEKARRETKFPQSMTL